MAPQLDLAFFVRRKRLLIIAACVLALGALLLFIILPWPLYYYQDAIKARIVDTETGEPIAGASVVAVWKLSIGGWEERWETYRYDEALTNGDGWFTIAGWGRRWRHRGEGRLKADDPILYIYKPGYVAERLTNDPAYVSRIGLLDNAGRRVYVPATAPEDGQVMEKRQGWRWDGARRFCFWNGKTVALRRSTTVQEDVWSLDLSDQLELSHADNIPHYWETWTVGWNRLPLSARDPYLLPSPIIRRMQQGRSGDGVLPSR